MRPFSPGFAVLVLFSTTAWPQQSLFNIPSSEITARDKLFFQQQINLHANGIGNTTFDYGLAPGLEVGVNFFNVHFYSTEGDLTNPFMLANIQKGFSLVDNWKIGIGTQAGYAAPVHSRQVRFLEFTFVNNALETDFGKYYLGAYHANRHYKGSGNNIGFMAGAEIPLWHEHFHFLADYISGNNDMSVAVVGGVFFLPSNWQLSLGAQLPSPGSGNEYGTVIEFTYLPPP